MSEHSFLKRRWKVILNVVTLLALIALIVAIRKQLIDTIENLANVDAWALLLLIPMQAVNYHAQTKLYQGLFGVVGNKMRYWFLYKASLELNFVNHVFPSGGVSGISYFGVRLRNGEITGGKATLIQIMKLMLVVLSFEALLIAGLVALAIGNKVKNFTILVTSSITTLMIVMTIAVVLIIGSEKRIRSTFTFLTRVINRVLHVFMPNSPETISIIRVQRVFEELHNNYKAIAAHWRELKMPLFWALMANVTEVGSIYVVYIAFGEWVNIGAVILAYAVANVAGFISVMPGGVGIYEALMTGVLVASGVPAALSLPVTVMYRVLNTLIQVPPCYILYHAALQRSKPESEMLRG